MNWEAIGAIGEIVGAIAVVITLVYLSVQMRTNTAAINQASIQATLLGRGEATRWVAGDQELNSLMWRGATNPEQLSNEEKQRYILLMGGVVRPLELAYIDYQAGRMSEALWKPQLETMIYWFAQPGFKMFIKEYGQTLYPDFVSHIQEEAKRSAG
jgi:hypothetical protein